MVPGATLMYGSILTSVTRRPRASRSAPIDAEATPLPSDDTTPPVTKMNFVFDPLFAMPTPPRQSGPARAPEAVGDHHRRHERKTVAQSRSRGGPLPGHGGGRAAFPELATGLRHKRRRPGGVNGRRGPPPRARR